MASFRKQSTQQEFDCSYLFIKRRHVDAVEEDSFWFPIDKQPFDQAIDTHSRQSQVHRNPYISLWHQDNISVTERAGL
jgi:hypothetical protein